MGILINKYFNKFIELIEGKWLIAGCVLYYFVINVFRDEILIPDLIIGLLLSMSGIILVFTLFRNNDNIFSSKTMIGRSLQFMGRRTLDIYWIHFFFIPYNLSFVTFFADNNMPILETATSWLIAVIITTVSLLVSAIIRLSPQLAWLLFGEKLEK